MKDIYDITYDLRENIKFKFFHGPLKFQSKIEDICSAKIFKT